MRWGTVPVADRAQPIDFKGILAGKEISRNTKKNLAYLWIDDIVIVISSAYRRAR